ncbi:MAG: hypothetical protein WCL39_02650, partial [Armatimonadota bacterium]
MLLSFFALPASAEYQKAVYAQSPQFVKAILVDSPKTVDQGGKLQITLTVEAQAPLADTRKVYIYLNQGDVTWHVQAVQPMPAASAWKAGKSKLKQITVTVPKDVPPGDYKIIAGVYKETIQGIGKISVKGKQPSRLGMIITRGSMIDKYGVPHEWHINKAHALIWDGQAWMPAGGMFVYNRDWNVVKAQIDLLHRYGVDNIYLHLGVNQPYPWKTYSDDDYKFFQQTIDYLDELGFKYGVEFQALEAKGPGYYYPAPGPRKDVKDSGIVTVQQDRSLGGVFIVFDKTTGAVVQTGDVTAIERKTVTADVKVPKPGDYSVVFAIKREAPDMYSMYYWDDKYPNYLEVVRKHYSKVSMGPGFRFLVDPLWNEMNMNRDFFPAAETYYKQFAAWLQKRYGTLEELNAKWRPTGTPIASFDDASRLVGFERKAPPGAKSDLQYVIDPQKKTVYSFDLTVSQFNYDMQEFLGRSLLYYTCDIADQFKKLYNVPVIYKGFSDSDFWHINDTGTPYGHDGLGMETYGNGEPMLLFMAVHLFGELEQATKTTWLVVTETGEGNHMDNSPSRNKLPGYSSRLNHMYANFNAMLSGGAKGIFQFNMIPGDGADQPWSDAFISDPRQFEWLATYDRMLANAEKLVDYKPQVYYRFPGMYNPNTMNLWSEPANDYANFGGWWWREPVERSENDIWIVPSFSLRPETCNLIVNLESTPATERHKAELVKAIKDGRRLTMIGFRRDLGAIPEIDKYYEDNYEIDSDGRKFQSLRATPTSRVLAKTKAGQIWNLIDGNLQIVSKQVFGMHGYRPDNLAFGAEKNIEPYYGFMDQLFQTKLLNLGPDLYGFTYTDGTTPVTVIGLNRGVKGNRSISLKGGDKLEATYPANEKAGKNEGGKLVVELQPVDETFVKVSEWPQRDQNPWVRQGILINSTAAKDSVIIKGLSAENAVPVEAPKQALATAAKELAELPAANRASFEGLISKARAAIDSGKNTEAMAILSTQADDFYSHATPYIWVEAEDRIDSNFNYSRLGGIPGLGGGAFLGLETAVEPPSDTGWFAQYRIDVPKGGAYQMWVRENYMGYSSPSSWRIDDGEWMQASAQLLAEDPQVVTLYNAVEDTRQIFAWYHYGAAKLSEGRHTITLRVDKKRGKGLAVTMADDRQYAKLVDCFLLTQGGFTPSGNSKPRSITVNNQIPLLNIVKNASFEFRPIEGQKIPDGWEPSEESDKIRWQDAGWGPYNVMQGLSIDLGQRFAYVGQRCLA